MIWLPFLSTLGVWALGPTPIAQDPTPPAEEAKWVELDSAALIVNEDIITTVEVIAAARNAVGPGATKEERARASDAIVTRKVSQLLQEQAGKVMGYDEKMVERFVQNEIDRQRERAGSVTKLAGELKARNLDSFTHRDEIRTWAYGMLWQRSQTGVDAAPKGRVAADRYVRPGRLHYVFKREEANIAADPILTVHNFGLKILRSPDEVRAALEELRQRVLAGGEFDAEVEALDAGKSKAEILSDRPLSGFRPSREVYAFLKTAEPGTISEVLEIRANGVLDGYRLVYLAERKQREQPSFSDPELQKKLREETEANLDAVRIDARLDELRHAAYVWPPEFLGRSTTIEN
ncbi:MAG: hypothetical protein IT453_01605 [Planctomycetes bacterium]|nr:hypothetical protein [Planctomycetota bacterium]